MLQAVRAGVFVAVDASCILRCLLVSNRPLARLSGVSFYTNAASRGCGAPGIARSDPKYRLLAPDHRCNEETAARRDAAELKPAPLTGGDARKPTRRATEKR